MTLVNQLPVLFRESAFNTQIDRLLADAIGTISGWSSTWEPNCNVYEDENGFCVQIALPGMEVNDIDVHVEDNTLRVKGERKDEASEGRTWYTREFLQGPFACSFRLPSYVDGHTSTASYKQGILTISFPKREEAKPRRIMIEGQ